MALKPALDVNVLATEVYTLMAQHAANGDVKAGNRVMEIGDELTRELVVGCRTLDELLDKWTAHGYRPTLKNSAAALLLADIYDFVAASRRIDVTAYRGLEAGKLLRVTPSTIEALDGAIEMLREIARGGSYTLLVFEERVRSYEAARDEHRRLENINERNRAAIRAMGGQRRQA